MRLIAHLPLVLLLLAGMAKDVVAESRSRVDESANQFSIIADDELMADTALMFSKQLLDQFVQLVDLKKIPKDVPIILVLGASDEKQGRDDGTVRIFYKPTGLKLQANWGEVPITRESFCRGWIRALCIRLAIANAQQSDVDESNSKQSFGLRIPMWVTDGMAGLVLESRVQRSVLLAKIHPEMTLNEALLELESKESLNPSQRSIASVICQALIQDPDIRKRFLSHMNWGRDLSSRAWLQTVVPRTDLDAWWMTIWKRQELQFSWAKMGYQPTLQWIVKNGDSPSSLRPETAWATNSGAVVLDFSAVAHPWFHSWFERYQLGLDRDRTGSERMEFLENIQLRRRMALTWFSEWETPGLTDTAQDFLMWDCSHRDSAKGEGSGPVSKWFDSFNKE